MQYFEAFGKKISPFTQIEPQEPVSLKGAASRTYGIVPWQDFSRIGLCPVKVRGAGPG